MFLLSKTPYLSTPRGDSLGFISSQELIDADLEVSGDQVAIFPRTIRVREAVPLTKVVWLARVMLSRLVASSLRCIDQ